MNLNQLLLIITNTLIQYIYLHYKIRYDFRMFHWIWLTLIDFDFVFFIENIFIRINQGIGQNKKVVEGNIEVGQFYSNVL